LFVLSAYLELRHGRWKDRQLLSNQWVDWALTPTPVQPTYGYMNWFLQAMLDRRLRYPARISDLRWSVYSHVDSRRAEKLKAGRIFIAGDTARIPNLGLDIGIQEAVNLAWKLALVYRGAADERLLGTYDEERRPIERQVSAATYFAFSVMGAQHGLLRSLRDHVARPFARTKWAQRLMKRSISEIGAHYRSSPLTLDQHVGGKLRSGDRVLNARVNVLSGPHGQTGPSRIFELHDPTKFTLLLLDARPPAGASHIGAIARTMATALPTALNVWHVTEPLSVEEQEILNALRRMWSVTESAGVEEQTLGALYGELRPSFCVIRPDGHIMSQGSADQARQAADFCKFWFNHHDHDMSHNVSEN
jgi:3-(3-hydroxy-phenyl)propionate hydroxylase